MPPRPGQQEDKPIDVVSTDGEGRFSFSGVPPGSYSLSVKKQGYLSGAFGKARYYDAGTPLELVETRNDVQILLWRQPVVIGTVQDEQGDLAAKVKVSILQRQTIGGRPMLVAKATAVTDDRGAFRSLVDAPGDYAVCVPSVQLSLPTPLYSSYFSGRLLIDRHMRRQLSSLGEEPPRPGSPNVTNRDKYVQISSLPSSPSAGSVYSTVCAPSSEPSDASTTHLGFGETSLPFHIQLKVSAAVTVSGDLVGPSAQIAHTALKLVDVNFRASLFKDDGFEAAATVTDSDGHFQLLGVRPGQYEIEAFVMSSDSGSAGQSSAPTGLRWLAEAVTVSGQDVQDLRLELHDGFRLAGRVIRMGAPEGPAPLTPATVALQLEPANGRLGGLAITSKADGSFQFPDIKPGRYVLRAMAPAGWALQSALLNGHDVSEEPFDASQIGLEEAVVTLTNRPTNLRVTAYGKDGRPDVLASVIMVATDRRYWVDYGWTPRRLTSARPDSAGVAEIVGMPPGTYSVAALSADRVAALTLVEISEAVSREGQRIELRDAERMQLRVPVNSGK